MSNPHYFVFFLFIGARCMRHFNPSLVTCLSFNVFSLTITEGEGFEPSRVLPPNDLANRPLHHLSNLPKYHVASVMICRHHLHTFASSAVPGTFTRLARLSTLELGCN